MAAKTFKAGDTVQLNSGGPVMTVRSVPVPGSSGQMGREYLCQWFAGKKLEQGYFPPDSLQSAAPEKKSPS